MTISKTSKGVGIKILDLFPYQLECGCGNASADWDRIHWDSVTQYLGRPGVLAVQAEQ